MSQIKSINKLTAAQEARFDEWADKWIEVGLRTGPADRPRFEAAAEQCYKHASLPWHGRVIWVSSPIVLAIAAPIAALILELRKNKKVDGAVRDAVDGAVRGAVRKAVAEVISKAWPYYLGGQFWPSGWYWGPAFTSFFREVCDLSLEGDLWERGKDYEATVESACWWYPHRDFIMVCERPVSIQRELTNPNVWRGRGSHRLHNAIGPAVVWPDGWGVYAVHGVRVPWWVVMRPNAITTRVIEAEKNAEVKRVMIEKYGEAKYITDSGMKPVARDAVFGDLYVQGLRAGRPIAKICVTNRSPEPDGTFRRYWLPINPEHYNGDAGCIPQAAVASTWRTTPGGRELFYKNWRDYRPAIET